MNEDEGYDQCCLNFLSGYGDSIVVTTYVNRFESFLIYCHIQSLERIQRRSPFISPQCDNLASCVAALLRTLVDGICLVGAFLAFSPWESMNVRLSL